MKIFNRLLNILFVLTLLLLIIVSISSLIYKRPLLMTTIRSNSMLPLMERGDIVFIKPVSKNSIKTGDIIVFTSGKSIYSAEKLIMHRVVGGNSTDGYITKGDANENIDQAMGFNRIKPEQIYSEAITISGRPLKIPLLGNITLWAEKIKGNPFILPGISLIIIVVLLITQLMFRRRKIRKKSKLDLPIIYFFSGLVVMAMFGSAMLASSRLIAIPYEVSDSDEGVLTGSSIGIIKKGNTIEDKHISTISNKGFFPFLVSVTSNDDQFTFNVDKLVLKPRQQIDVKINVLASHAGQYNSIVYIGFFMPFLPLGIIHSLAQINYWLALAALSAIPGLPVMLYPVINSTMRRAAAREIRRKIRKTQEKFLFG